LPAQAARCPSKRGNSTPFCHGATVANYNFCHGPAQSLIGDQGWGAQTSICIGIGAISGGCAPTGQLKQMSLGAYIWEQPWIRSNAGNPTVVYGSTW
jgi:hypothetical protein